jgi:hypothetical protein
MNIIVERSWWREPITSNGPRRIDEPREVPLEFRHTDWLGRHVQNSALKILVANLLWQFIRCGCCLSCQKLSWLLSLIETGPATNTNTLKLSTEEDMLWSKDRVEEFQFTVHFWRNWRTYVPQCKAWRITQFNKVTGLHSITWRCLTMNRLQAGFCQWLFRKIPGKSRNIIK